MHENFHETIESKTGKIVAGTLLSLGALSLSACSKSEAGADSPITGREHALECSADVLPNFYNQTAGAEGTTSVGEKLQVQARDLDGKPTGKITSFTIKGLNTASRSFEQTQKVNGNIASISLPKSFLRGDVSATIGGKTQFCNTIENPANQTGKRYIYKRSTSDIPTQINSGL